MTRSIRLFAALCIVHLPIANMWQYNRLPAEHPFTLYFWRAALVTAIAGVALALYSARRPAAASRLFWPLLVILVAANVAVPSALFIHARHILGPPNLGHDGMVQTEDALELIAKGISPYGFDYGTLNYGKMTLGNAPEAVRYHLPYWPGLLLPSLVVQRAFLATLGWYDQRFFFWVTYLLLGFVVIRWAQSEEGRRLAAMGAFFNPAFNAFFIEGRNDIFPLALLLASIELVRRRWLFTAGLLAGWSLATKLTMLFAGPAALAFLLGNATREGIQRALAGAAVALALLVGPFLVWDPKGLWEDSFGFVLGFIKVPYPPTGFSIVNLCVSMGLVTDVPGKFVLALQALVGLPVLAWTLLRQWRSNDTAHLVLHIAIFSTLMFFLSRFFNDNYAAYVSTLFIIAYGLFERDRTVRPEK